MLEGMWKRQNGKVHIGWIPSYHSSIHCRQWPRSPLHPQWCSFEMPELCRLCHDFHVPSRLLNMMHYRRQPQRPEPRPVWREEKEKHTFSTFCTHAQEYRLSLWNFSRSYYWWEIITISYLTGGYTCQTYVLCLNFCHVNIRVSHYRKTTDKIKTIESLQGHTLHIPTYPIHIELSYKLFPHTQCISSTSSWLQM